MKFYGQYKQDEYVFNNFFKNKKNGFFIDIGAHDGISLNNTYFFEKLGWSGICIEPTPYVFEKLSKNRNCELLNIALSDITGEMDFMVLSGYTQMLSSLINNYDPRHINRINGEMGIKYEGSLGSKEIIKIKTNTFMSLNTPKVIDFVSLDVEGSEMNILRGIDFNEKLIKVITVENNYHDKTINDILENNGFIVNNHLGCDTVFVNPKNLEL